MQTGIPLIVKEVIYRSLYFVKNDLPNFHVFLWRRTKDEGFVVNPT